MNLLWMPIGYVSILGIYSHSPRPAPGDDARAGLDFHIELQVSMTWTVLVSTPNKRCAHQ